MTIAINADSLRGLMATGKPLALNSDIYRGVSMKRLAADVKLRRTRDAKGITKPTEASRLMIAVYEERLAAGER